MDNKNYTTTLIRRDLKGKIKKLAKSRGKLLYALLDEIVTKYLGGKNDNR